MSLIFDPKGGPALGLGDLLSMLQTDQEASTRLFKLSLLLELAGAAPEPPPEDKAVHDLMLVVTMSDALGFDLSTTKDVAALKQAMGQIFENLAQPITDLTSTIEHMLPPQFEQPYMACPSCALTYPDHDGFGVAYCPPPVGCGYCRHLSRTFTGNAGICDYCGDVNTCA